MHPKTRHAKLLDNKRVGRWYKNLEVRSTITANVYLRNLGLWLEYLDKDPESIIEFAQGDFEEFKGSIADQIRKMEREGKQGAYISTSMKPLISYLKFHNVNVKLSLNIKNENRNLNTEKEIVPSKDQLSAVLRVSKNLRDRAAISLMAFSGLRPVSIGNDEGNDGLRLGDIEDLDLDSLEFSKIPAKIKVRAENSKTRLSYFTFLGNEGCKYLKEYLRERNTNKEPLDPNSAVILPDERKSMKHSGFFSTTLLTRRIKLAITKAGFDWRPYILRAYFDTNLESGEAKGLISHAQRQFIMGHKGDIEEVYTKRNSDDVKVDEIREAYEKCLKFIETAQRGIPEESLENLEIMMTKKALKWFGFSDEEINELAHLSDDELQQKIKEKRVMQINNGNKQKVITVKDVEKFISDGWEYMNSLPGDKAIIKIPD